MATRADRWKRASLVGVGAVVLALTAAACGDDTTDPGPTPTGTVTGTGTATGTGGGTAGTGGGTGATGGGGTGATGGGGSGGAPSGEYYATYLGGANENDQLRGTALDSQGSLYFVGGAFAANIASCVGPHQGGMDVIVGKVTVDGSLAWCRYLGGPNYDRFYDIEVNSNETQVVIAGRASNGFPVTNGKWDTTFNNSQSMCGGSYGRQDGAVCALDAATGTVAWCTYTGFSNGCDFIRTIALDANDDVILGTGFDGTVNDAQYTSTFLNGPSGGQDGIVGKLSADGSTLHWYRYIGGSGDNAVEGMVAVDSAGIYYSPAWTRDATHTIVGGFDSTYGGNNMSDIYLVRLSLDGTTIEYATYAGGTAGEDQGMHGVILSGTPGTVFVKSGTASTDFPTTAGVISQTRSGPNDCGLIKVDTLQTGAASLVAGTYLGGSSNDFCEGGALVPGGMLALSGNTGSSDFPVTGDARYGSLTSADDGWVAIVSGDLTSIVYASYLGGSAADTIRAIDASTALIAGVGQSQSTDFPTTPNAVQQNFSGGTEADGVVVLLPY